MLKRSTPLLLALLLAVSVLSASASAFSSTPTSTGFGFHTFEASLSATQAGSHPNLTLAFEFNNAPNQEGGLTDVGGEVRNLTVNLPPGFAVNATAVPQCPRRLFDHESCPADTQIGVDTARLDNGTEYVGDQVYNLEPPAGAPAEFALDLVGIETFISGGVRSGGDYGLTGHVGNIPQRGILYNTITLFGEVEKEVVVDGHGQAERTPLLTLPTSCAGPLKVTMDASTWEEPDATATAEVETPAITGCEALVHFTPSITAAPDTSEADTPAGLTVDVLAPQGLNPEGLATTGIKDTTVTLPEGVVINPGQAAGLQACPPGPPSFEPGHEHYGDDLPLPGEDGEEEGFAGPPHCPSASKVGAVEIETPLLRNTLKGSVYVLRSNPPNLQLLLAASADGVNLKLVGEVHLDPVAGRLTTRFDGNPGYEGTPNLPFTELRLSFSGGAQAALATPTHCGVYTTTADFTPWATPLIPDVFPTSMFAIDAGPNGDPCPSSPLPFAPSMIAGSTSDQAGGYTDFSMLLRRADAQQRIERLQFKAPPGLLGMISNVTPCTNAQAEANACPEASRIGHTVVTSGPGPYPLVVPEPGRPPAPIYLTEAYAGAPFGLAIVVPLEVGPFTLETQRVRAKIEVDPRTAQITVTTDPLPQIVDGVPTDLRTVDAVIDRPGFMFNPTNCDPMAFAGTATGAEGASAPLESRFRVGSCRSLHFTPRFAVSTSGKTSRTEGTSLSAKLTYPAGAPEAGQATSQANIARVKVELPKQLPSRLTTLRKACLAAVFESNPASCPAASDVGSAKVLTPVLPVPLTGPVYFVSHGGEAFPSLIVVLQGDGVTAEVEATTFIAKKSNVTSLTFNAAPDVPFSSFELTSPQGPYSALTTNGSLCKGTLVMPTELEAQNGAVIKQATKIRVTGCPKAKKTSKKRKARKKAGGKNGRK